VLARRRVTSSDIAGGDRLRMQSASSSCGCGFMISRVGLRGWEMESRLVRLLATAAYCDRFCGKLLFLEIIQEIIMN